MGKDLKMRIGIVSPFSAFEFGDFFESERDRQNLLLCSKIVAPSISSLVRSFLNEGHFVRVFSVGDVTTCIKGKQLEVFFIKREETYPIKYLWGIFNNARHLKQVVLRNCSDLDLLHSQWSYEHTYAIHNLRTNTPVFCTVRDWAPLIFRYEKLKNKPLWFFKLIMSNIVYRTSHIHFVSNSPYTASLLLDHLGIASDMIPNSIENCFFNKLQDKIETNQIRILCISSSLDKRKNVKALLWAFSKLRTFHKDAHLEIIGAPFYDNNVELATYKAEGLLSDNVKLLGRVPHKDLIKYLDSATVFVSPSLEETFGNTLLEAISRKLPVIGGKDSGAVPFVLQQGKIGWLCDVSNPDDIYQTIEYVLEHKQEARDKAELGYRIIQEKFGEKQVCDQHIRLYLKYCK